MEVVQQEAGLAAKDFLALEPNPFRAVGDDMNLAL
jgi:hypothetical protein